MINVIRCCGKYLLLMSLIYCIQSIMCWANISMDDFNRIFYARSAYAQEMFWYSLVIERMKVVHSICLLLISAYLATMTASGQLLTDKHYRQMLWITVTITLFYVMPLFFLVYHSYTNEGPVWDENSQQQK